MTTSIPIVEEWNEGDGLPEWLRVPLQLAREAFANDTDSEFSGNFNYTGHVDPYKINKKEHNFEQYNAVDINFYISPCDEDQRWNVVVCPADFNREDLYLEFTDHDFALYEGELQDVYWEPS